jgi:outer membrane lipoprotein-sorting protein
MTVSRRVVAALLLLLSRAAAAYDAKEVIQRVNLQNSPITEKTNFEMVLIDSGGGQTRRTGTQYFRRRVAEKPESFRLFRFHSPPEMAKSAVLLVENGDKDNEQWIYLPATYSTRKIPARNRGDRYMGTDFSYEDAVSYRVSEYAFTALQDETIDGVKCLKIEQRPSDPRLERESLYSRIVQWVDPEKNVQLRSEYYDKSGALLKTYRASTYVKVGDAYRASHVEMEDLKLRHKTIIDYTERDTATPIKESFFTTRSLERPD